VLLLFWGAFFIEHLGWFMHPGSLPPPKVFLMQGLHLMMLLGFVIGWRWELAGGILILAGALPFFAFAAGERFLVFAAVTALPAALWIVNGLWTARQKRAAANDVTR
jgi:hypothetical protein